MPPIATCRGLRGLDVAGPFGGRPRRFAGLSIGVTLSSAGVRALTGFLSTIAVLLSVVWFEFECRAPVGRELIDDGVDTMGHVHAGVVVDRSHLLSDRYVDRVDDALAVLLDHVECRRA